MEYCELFRYIISLTMFLFKAKNRLGVYLWFTTKALKWSLRKIKVSADDT